MANKCSPAASFLKYLIIIPQILLVISHYTVAQEKLEGSPAGGSEIKTYLPGDLVHIVVGAPSNVAEIFAVTPDGQRISLDFERRTHTWHGFWEVPYGFKKGIYRANLIAVDVEGKTFEGSTNAFYIGEPSLVTLIGVKVSSETVRAPLLEQPPPTVSHRPSEKKEGKRTERVKKQKAQPPVKIAKKQKKAAKAKPKALVDVNLIKTRLATEARTAVLKQEYKKARLVLKSMLKIDPQNQEIRSLLNRIEAVLKLKGAM